MSRPGRGGRGASHAPAPDGGDGGAQNPPAPPAPAAKPRRDFTPRGAAEDGQRGASRFGYRRDDRHLLFPQKWRAFAPVGLGGVLPVSDLTPAVVDVLDQGAAPFCFAGAVAQALRMCDVRNGMPNPVLPSRLELVHFTHAIEGDATAFDGAYISDVFRVIEQIGFAPESAWPYDDKPDGNHKVRPPQDVLRLSYDQINLSYERILSTGAQREADVAVALASGKPVVFGTDVSNAFARNDLPDDFVVDVPEDGDIAGGHAMILCGRRANGDFRCLNDWSDGWGDDGYCWLTPRMIRWAQTRELWAVNFSRPSAVIR